MELQTLTMNGNSAKTRCQEAIQSRWRQEQEVATLPTQFWDFFSMCLLLSLTWVHLVFSSFTWEWDQTLCVLFYQVSYYECQLIPLSLQLSNDNSSLASDSFHTHPPFSVLTFLYNLYVNRSIHAFTTSVSSKMLLSYFVWKTLFTEYLIILLTKWKGYWE